MMYKTTLNFVPLLLSLNPGGAGKTSASQSPAIEVTSNTQKDISFTVFKIDPAQTNFEITFPQTAACKEGVLTFNGGFFNDEHLPNGLLISKGKQIAPLSSKKIMSGIFMIKNGKAIIIRTNLYQPDTKVDFALQNGPLIIEPGGLRGIKGDSMEAERTVLVTDKVGKAYLVVIKTPTTLSKVQELLLKIIPNIDAALNLDGGPSTFYYYGGKTTDFSFGSAEFPAYFVTVSPSHF